MSRRLFYPLFFGFILCFFAQLALAKDTWVNVRSKNFFLIGNAGEKEIRQVATKLEQFRETFRLLFPRTKFTQAIQTNVIVFKNDAAYRPFKPKLADGKPNDGVAGYFQPGEDLNYITLAAGGEKTDTYGTVFHEYVHFLLDTNFGKSEVPPWFNEGLAEYYQTFKIEDDQKVTLGDIQNNHLALLQQTQLIPLKTFFEIDNYSLHQNGNHSRSIFYAQAWALIHYLLQGENGSNSEALNKFLNLVMNRVEPEKAFQQAFQIDYAAMEKALKNYVSQRKYRISIATFKNKLVFDTEMTAAPLTEAEANAYLGDLLYHTHEYDNAEVYLQKALALDANSSLANTSLGLVRMQQRKFDEAKKYLEKAIASDAKNHFAHYNYAYILSRESMDEFGYVSKFPPEAMKKMRESLQKAITLNPNFTESYHLLGYINLVNNNDLDDSIAFLQKALSLQPGNQHYAFIIAQIYMRQNKYAEAKQLITKLVKTADDPSLRSNAQNLLNTLQQIENQEAADQKHLQEMEKQGYRQPVVVKQTADKPLSEAELAKIKEENENNELNRMIERPQNGEQQVAGYFEKVSCVNGTVVYSFKTDTETIPLSSKDFQGLELNALDEAAASVSFGCDAQVQNLLTVIIYQTITDPKSKSKGNLRYIAFVPKFFKLKTLPELAEARTIIVLTEGPPQNSPEEQAEWEKQRREAMLRGINDSLRKPLDGEKRELGVVEKIECSGNSIIYVSKIGTQTLKLKTKSPNDVKIVGFTPEAEGLQFGCGVKLPPVPAVITYRPNNKDGGELVALEFVPKSFKLPS